MCDQDYAVRPSTTASETALRELEEALAEWVERQRLRMKAANE